MRSSVDALIGLAVGDAVGVPVEFVSRERLQQEPVTGIRDYGSHSVPAGTWSDDTSMTIATIQAIVDRKDIDYHEIMNNFYLWLSENQFTADGRVFGVGRTCLRAVMKWAKEHCDPVSAGKDGERYNGNGSLMRFMPVPFYCYARGLEEQEIVELCGRMSSLTHRHETSQLGCYIYTLFMMQLLQHGSKELAYEYIKNETYEFYSQESVKKYSRLLRDDIRLLREEEIQSTGYIVFTLEAAIWCFLTEDDYESIILKAVNLGHDTDTIGAVAGSMAGIVYGIDRIPAKWVNVLQRKEYLIDLAKKFDLTIDPSESNLN